MGGGAGEERGRRGRQWRGRRGRQRRDRVVGGVPSTVRHSHGCHEEISAVSNLPDLSYYCDYLSIGLSEVYVDC